MDTIKEFDPRKALWASKTKIEALLPSHMEFERFAAMSLRAYVEAGEKIQKCKPESFLESVLKAAKFGLELDGIVGEAYLVPFKGECSLIPGYKGLLKLAHQAEAVKSVICSVVYKADKFRYQLGMHVDLRHIPLAETDEELKDENITHAYAVFFLKNGAAMPFCWPVSKIRKHRDQYSKSYKSAEKNRTFDSTWHTAFPKMSLKTVLRDALGGGTIPISSEIHAMIQTEKALEGEEYRVPSNPLDEVAAALAVKRTGIEHTPQAPNFSQQAEAAKQQREQAETVAAERTQAEAVKAAKAEPAQEQQQSVQDANDIVEDYKKQIAACKSEEEAKVVCMTIHRSKALTEDQKKHLRRLGNDKVHSFGGV